MESISEIAIATWCDERDEQWELLPFDRGEPNIQVQPNNERGVVVTDVRLMGFDGGVLGGTLYSELTANGTWKHFVSMVDCGECEHCGYQNGDLTTPTIDNGSDSNPNTGTSLGVVSLLIVGSAVWVARKRK
jgi:hypothetical protein